MIPACPILNQEVDNDKSQMKKMKNGFTWTNLAKPEPRGDPLYRAMDAPFNREV